MAIRLPSSQINEVFEPYQLGVIAASNDRIGGWQLMYQMLQKGEWQIADTCPKLIEAIPSRMHDEKRPGDVLKVPGDPLDDVADDAKSQLPLLHCRARAISRLCKLIVNLSAASSRRTCKAEFVNL